MKLEIANRTNGVDVARLQDTVSAVKGEPGLGLFRFHIENRWLDSGANQSKVSSFYGCGEQQSRPMTFTLVADEPDILLGGDTGANPVEYLLHALAACVTTSMVYHAAARGIEVEEVESSLEGEIDVRGFLGLDPSVRKGYQQIRMKLRIKANGSDEQFQELSKLGPAFSAVYDSLTNGVPVSVSAERIQ